MGTFYEFNLRSAGCLTYVSLPIWGLMGVCTYLENHHVPYRVREVIGTPVGAYLFRGRRGFNDAVVIESGMDPEDLLDIAEETFYIPFGEIGEEYCPVDQEHAGCTTADLWREDGLLLEDCIAARGSIRKWLENRWDYSGTVLYCGCEWLELLQQIYAHEAARLGQELPLGAAACKEIWERVIVARVPADCRSGGEELLIEEGIQREDERWPEPEYEEIPEDDEAWDVCMVDCDEAWGVCMVDCDEAD